MVEDWRKSSLVHKCSYVWTAVTDEIMEVFQYSPFIYCNYQTWQEQREGKQEKTKEVLAYRQH